LQRSERLDRPLTRAPWLCAAAGVALCACPEPTPPAQRSAPVPPVGADIRLSDVTAAAGVQFHHITGGSGNKFLVEPHCGGCAVLDADGDGRPDLYAVDGGPLPGYTGGRRRSNRLFRNRGDGTFEDVTEGAGTAGTAYGFGAFPADYDGDGDDDLFVTQLGPDLLYRNRGDGSFEEVGLAAGVAADAWSTSAAWLDYDADGDLDLYVTRYVEYELAKTRVCIHRGVRHNCGPWDYTPAQDQLFRNRGDGTFEDVTREAGMAAAKLHGLGVLAYDLDLDGRPDLYVANDKTPNLLFHNLGGGRFEEIGLEAGVAVGPEGTGQAGMGIDAGDLDGDGLPDLVVTNFQQEWNNDFRQVAAGLFIDRGRTSGFGPPSGPRLGFGALMFDLELDGDLDVFVANGHVWSSVSRMLSHVTYPQTNLLFRNNGGKLDDVSSEAGEPLRRKEVSRGSCLLDYDGDGDLDLFYVNLDAPAVLLRNDTRRSDNHWLQLRLRGAGVNTGALGARVLVRVGERTLARQIWPARGFLSSSDRTAHFGLGQASRADAVRITWPGGDVTNLGPLDADRLYDVSRVAGKATPRP